MDGLTSAERTAPPVVDPVADPRRAAARVAAVVVLLTFVVLGAATAGPWAPTVTEWSREDRLLPEEPPQQAPVAPPPDASGDIPVLLGEDLPFDLTWLWSVVALVLSLGIGWLVLHIVRRHQTRHPMADPHAGDGGPGEQAALVDLMPDLAELRAGLEDAADHLRSNARAADAIVAAWVVLEAAAERSGVPRDPADTPTEFTVDVMDRTEADPTAIRTLLGLYLRARFSDERLGRDDVDVARAAVDTLTAALVVDG